MVVYVVMETSLKEELEKLYKQVSSATATTDFYNRVYKYISFIKQSDLIKDILNKDLNEWKTHNKEKVETLPYKQDGENDLDIFIKEHRHVESGEQQFLNFYNDKIAYGIFDPLNWWFTEGKETMESDTMLNGRREKKNILYIFKRSDYPKSLENYDKIYIDNFRYWKQILDIFHKLLLTKIDTHIITRVDPNIIFFSDKDRSLYFFGKKVPMSIKSDITDAQRVLVYLLKDPMRVVDFSDEKYNEFDDKVFNNVYDKKKTTKKFDNAIAELVRKIKMETQIDDFIIFTTGVTGSVQINEKYLSKIRKTEVSHQSSV